MAKPIQDPMQAACAAYIKLLKDTEELTQELRYMAAESFKEGWMQCERTYGLDPNILKTKG